MVDVPYQNPYIDPYPGATQSSIDMRRRYALGVLQQAGDGSPTKANAIGAIARALQGALGGYMAGQADQSDLADKAKTQALVQQLIGGGSPVLPQASAVTSAPVQTADASMPRGLRNNNPLNIEAGGFTQSQPGFAGSDGRFAQFQTPQQGIGAANALLDTYQNKYGLNTPAGIVGRWAPSSDGNNVSAYAADVAAKLGIGPNDPISPQMRPQLIAAMAQHENGRPLPPTMLAGPSPTPDSVPQAAQGQPQQMAQNAPQAVPPAGDPNRAAIIAQLLATRSGAGMASAVLPGLIADKPTFGTIGHDQFGNPTMGWIDANRRTVTPVNGQISQTQTGAPGQSSVNGDEFLKTLDKPVADQVKALAEGRMAFPAGFALKSPYWQRMVQYVSQYDPSFDAVNYNARTKTRNDFTSGKSAQSINAMNTVAGHLETLSNAADALNNTSYPLVNSVTNMAANAVGDPRIKQFDTTKKAVVDELTRVWRGSGGSEGDIKTWSDQINAANSPQQLHTVIGQLGELIQSKMNALGEQYKQGMGTTAQPIQLVTPKSAAVFEKLKKRAEGDSTATQAPQAPQATTPKPGAYRFNPATGQLEPQ